MNSLSILIYFAEILPNIGFLLILSLTIGMLCYGTYLIVAFVDNDRGYKNRPTYLGRAVFVFLATGLVASLIPSKETIYLIAGSEAGEMVVSSDAGQEILSDIQEIIKFQLGELKGESSE